MRFCSDEETIDFDIRIEPARMEEINMEIIWILLVVHIVPSTLSVFKLNIEIPATPT